MGQPTVTTVTVRTDQPKVRINRNVFGHFSEHLGRGIYDGIWVGANSDIPNTDGIRNDVVEALRALEVPVLRWPGGCFADNYHWRNGLGRLEERTPMVNGWGNVIETNEFGTHEFFRLCELIGAQPYVCGNLGSGTVEEMQQWVEYISGSGAAPMARARRANGREEPWPLPFFGIGNENWGCGGHMRPQYYADLYNRFASYIRGTEDAPLVRVAGGPNEADYKWMKVLMRECAQRMEAISVHFYTAAGDFWHEKGDATGFGEDGWFKALRRTLELSRILKRHIEIMDRYDPDGFVALYVDEWGSWYNPDQPENGRLYQQNTLRDALIAAVNLNLFANLAERVQMANIAQMVNVLQAVILTFENQIVLTPTYHVFDLFRVHRDATLLPTEFDTSTYKHGCETLPQLSIASSKHASGSVNVTICNLNPNEGAEIEVAARGFRISRSGARGITAERMDAHNTFSDPDAVSILELPEPKLRRGASVCEVPPKSVVGLTLSLAS